MRLRRKAYFSGGFNFTQSIAVDTQNYSLIAAATAAGWNGTTPINASITVASGVKIYGSLSGVQSAFTVGSLPPGSFVNIICDGQIIGHGGAGGGSNTSGGNGKDGLSLAYPVTISGSGYVAGGGGGGGGGASIVIDSPNGQYTSNGGNGGAGAGFSSGGPPPTTGQTGVAGPRVGDATYYAQGGIGGTGGALGMNGAPGSSGTGVGTVNSSGIAGAGGLAGKSVTGCEYLTITGSVQLIGGVTYGTTKLISPPAAAPSIGASSAGGYYAGLMWQVVTASPTTCDDLATSTASVKTFSVPAQVDAAIFYTGQSLEFRSQSDPNVYVRGSVTSAGGGNVTLGSLSVSNTSTTATGWFCMAQHRLIVAPKSGGETTLAVANGTLPAACWTLNEGYAATQAMLAAGDAAAFPGPYWAAGLSIGGFADWYIPARDELERIWRYLKPTTNSNYVTADRPTGASASYATNGAKGDTSASHGVNNNSAALPGPYTTGSPGQSSATVFRTGGAQALEYGAAVYASSTGYDASNLWAQSYQTATPGRQITQAKGTAALIRAVRKTLN